MVVLLLVWHRRAFGPCADAEIEATHLSTADAAAHAKLIHLVRMLERFVDVNPFEVSDFWHSLFHHSVYVTAHVSNSQYLCC